MLYQLAPELLPALARLEPLLHQQSSEEQYQLLRDATELYLKSSHPLPLEQTEILFVDGKLKNEAHEWEPEVLSSSSSLLDLLTFRTHPNPELPARAVLIFESEQAALPWILESIHLGKDKLFYTMSSTQHSSSEAKEFFLIRIEEPSFFQLIESHLQVFIEYQPHYWVPFGTHLEHLETIFGQLPRSTSSIFLSSPFHQKFTVPEAGWSDLYQLLSPRLLFNGEEIFLPSKEGELIDLPLQFIKLKTPKKPSAWLLFEHDLPHWHELLSESSELDLLEWSYHIGVLPASSSLNLGSKPQTILLLLNKMGSSFPYTGKPLYQWMGFNHLYLPTEYLLTPQLRQDSYYRLFQSDPRFIQVYLPESSPNEGALLHLEKEEYPLSSLIEHRLLAERIFLERFAFAGTFSLDYWSKLPQLPDIEKAPLEKQTVSKEKGELSINEKEPVTEEEELEELLSAPLQQALPVGHFELHRLAELQQKKRELIQHLYLHPEAHLPWLELHALYQDILTLYTERSAHPNIEERAKIILLKEKVQRTIELVIFSASDQKELRADLSKLLTQNSALFQEIFCSKEAADEELFSWQQSLRALSPRETNLLLWWSAWERVIIETSNERLYEACKSTVEQELKEHGLSIKEFPEDLLSELQRIHLSSEELSEMPQDAAQQLLSIIKTPYWKAFCHYMLALLIGSHVLEGDAGEQIEAFIQSETELEQLGNPQLLTPFSTPQIKQFLLRSFNEGLPNLSSASPEHPMTRKWHQGLLQLRDAELSSFEQLMDSLLNHMGQILSVGTAPEEHTLLKQIKELHRYNPFQALQLLREDLTRMQKESLFELGIPYLLSLRQELHFLLLSEASEELTSLLKKLCFWLQDQQSASAKRWMMSIVFILQPISHGSELIRFAFDNIETYFSQLSRVHGFQLSKLSFMLIASIQILPSDERIYFLQRLFSLLEDIDIGPKNMFQIMLLSLKALSTDMFFIETQQNIFLKRVEISLLGRLEKTHSLLTQ